METTRKTSCCDHVRWGVMPVEVKKWIGEQITGVGMDGEPISKSYYESIWQCPLCQTECDAPESEKERE